MSTFRLVRSVAGPVSPAVRVEAARGLAAETIHAANDAFVDVLLREGEWPVGRGALPLTLLQALRSLSCVQRRRISALPFTLFSLRFSDAAFWRGLIEQSTEPPRRGGVDESFCRTAVFLAWHLAHVGPNTAGMALGMSSDVVALYQWVSLSDLDRLAALAQSAIAPRWPAHSGFWRRLLDAAQYPPSIDAARYFGLHLLAGECLPRDESRLRA